MAFEEDLARLEELVRCLEEGRLSLEESLAAFQEGMALATRLADQLQEAEQKIAVVTAGAGGAPRLTRASDLAPEGAES